MDAPQAIVSAKSPVTGNDVTAKEPDPLLVIVICIAALVVPTDSGGKISEFDDINIDGDGDIRRQRITAID